MKTFFRFNSLFRGTAFVLALAQAVLGLPWVPARAAFAAASPTSVSVLEPFEPKALPSDLGRIEDYSAGTGDKTIILIQDAHAIPEAQRSIQKLIQYFQKNDGVTQVAFEGASSAVDTTLFRSFPDKTLLKKVFKRYHESGELTGVSAAALFHEMPAVYKGIEDWGLYEKGLGFYLEALAAGTDLQNRLAVWKKSLKARKEKTDSPALLEMERSLEDFHQNKTGLLDVLKILAKTRRPDKASELSALLEEAEKEGRQDELGETALRVLADEIKSFWQKTPSADTGAAEEFYQHYQAFQTGAQSAQVLALFLEELIETQPSLLSPASREEARVLLSRLAGNQKRLRDIEGARFFKDFETYARLVKTSLLRTEAQRSLDLENDQWELMDKLSRLELSRSEWESLKGILERPKTERRSDEMDWKEFKAHLDFYRNAEQREGRFFEQLSSLPGAVSKNLPPKNEKQTCLFVAGGFHAQGMIERFKRAGLGYVLVIPALGQIPEKTAYHDQMQGRVSWSDYFQERNGRVNLHEAFVRAARDRLLYLGGAQPDPRLLKNWRDEVIRRLADENRLGEASRYTRFLDELTDEAHGEHDASGGTLLSRMDRFISGLKVLEKSGQVNEAHLRSLLTRPAGRFAMPGHTMVAGPVSAEFSGNETLSADLLLRTGKLPRSGMGRSEVRVNKEAAKQSSLYTAPFQNGRAEKPIQIRVLGGADDAGPGASSYLLTVAGKNILLDAGSGSAERLRQSGIDVDVVLLSHAHRDHTGDLLRAFNRHEMPVYSLAGTTTSAQIMLKDSLLFETPKDRPDLRTALKRIPRYWRSVEPNTWYQLDENIKVLFQPTPHISGASIVYIATPYGNLAYTGDFSQEALRGSSAFQLLPDFHPAAAGIGLRVARAQEWFRKIMRKFAGFILELKGLPLGILRWARNFYNAFSPYFPVDQLWMESTYGLRTREKPRADREKEFAEDLAPRLNRGAKALVPVFALGRVVDVALTIRDAQEKGLLPQTAKIYVDGLAALTLEDYIHQLESTPNPTEEARREFRLLAGYEIGDLEKADTDRVPVVFVNKKQRDEIINNKIEGAYFVLAGSGSLAGGQAVRYLKVLGADPKNVIVQVGYQFAGTYGRQLAEGKRRLSIEGETVDIRADVVSHDFGAHGDLNDLVDLALRIGASETRLVHGELGAKLNLAQSLESAGLSGVLVPKTGDQTALLISDKTRQARQNLFSLLSAQPLPIKPEESSEMAPSVQYPLPGEAGFKRAQTFFITEWLALLHVENIGKNDGLLRRLILAEETAGVSNPLETADHKIREEIKKRMGEHQADTPEYEAMLAAYWQELIQKYSPVKRMKTPVTKETKAKQVQERSAKHQQDKRKKIVDEFSASILAAFAEGEKPGSEEVAAVLNRFLDAGVLRRGETAIPLVKPETGDVIVGFVAEAIQAYLYPPGIERASGTRAEAWRRAWEGLSRDFGGSARSEVRNPAPPLAAFSSLSLHYFSGVAMTLRGELKGETYFIKLNYRPELAQREKEIMEELGQNNEVRPYLPEFQTGVLSAADQQTLEVYKKQVLAQDRNDPKYAGMNWTVLQQQLAALGAGTAVLVIKQASGENFGSYLQKLFPLHDDAAMTRALLPVARALETLHAQGVFHRDLSMYEVFLEPGSGKITILDWHTAVTPRHSYEQMRAQGLEGIRKQQRTDYTPILNRYGLTGMPESMHRDVESMLSMILLYMSWGMSVGRNPSLSVLNTHFFNLKAQPRLPGTLPMTVLREELEKVLAVLPRSEVRAVPASDESEQALRQIIQNRIRESGGRISFRDFMEISLYHPQLGYYTGGKAVIGSGRANADFETFVEKEPDFFSEGILYDLIAKWLRLGSPARFQVVEMGAGRGTLAKFILKTLKGLEQRKDVPDEILKGAKGFMKALEYVIVEISPEFRLRQQAAVAESLENPEIGKNAVSGEGLHVRWASFAAHRLSGDADPEGVNPLAEPMPRIFISNELPDAFPVHRVRYRETAGRGAELQEAYVTVNEKGEFIEVWDRLDSSTALRIELALQRMGSVYEEYLRKGGEIAVNLQALEWQSGIAKIFNRSDEDRGFVLTIDYGYRGKRYVPDNEQSVRSHGAAQPLIFLGIKIRGLQVIAFIKRIGSAVMDWINGFSPSVRRILHRLNPLNLFNSDAAYLYEHPGQVDLTADVDFDLLDSLGSRVGLTTELLTSQAQFFKQTGLTSEKARRLSQDGFYAMVQSKGVSRSEVRPNTDVLGQQGASKREVSMPRSAPTALTTRESLPAAARAEVRSTINQRVDEILNRGEAETKRMFDKNEWLPDRRYYGIGEARDGVFHALSGVVNALLDKYLEDPFTPLVDIGAGEGFLGRVIYRRWTEKANQYMPYDLNPVFLNRIVQQKLAKKTVRGSVYELSRLLPPTPAFISTDAFDTFEDLDAAFREVAQALTPGGKLFLFQTLRADIHPLYRGTYAEEFAKKNVLFVPSLQTFFKTDQDAREVLSAFLEAEDSGLPGDLLRAKQRRLELEINPNFEFYMPRVEAAIDQAGLRLITEVPSKIRSWMAVPFNLYHQKALSDLPLSNPQDVKSFTLNHGHFYPGSISDPSFPAQHMLEDVRFIAYVAEKPAGRSEVRFQANGNIAAQSSRAAQTFVRVFREEQVSRDELKESVQITVRIGVRPVIERLEEIRKKLQEFMDHGEAFIWIHGVPVETAGIYRLVQPLLEQLKIKLGNSQHERYAVTYLMPKNESDAAALARVLERFSGGVKQVIFKRDNGRVLYPSVRDVIRKQGFVFGFIPDLRRPPAFLGTQIYSGLVGENAAMTGAGLAEPLIPVALIPSTGDETDPLIHELELTLQTAAALMVAEKIRKPQDKVTLRTAAVALLKDLFPGFESRIITPFGNGIAVSGAGVENFLADWASRREIAQAA